jgi:hypothetical protein
MNMKQILSGLLFTVLIIQLTILSSPILLSAQTSPSAPEFTLNLVKATTGELKIQIIVKNQPYSSTISGVNSEFHYNVHLKGHFSNAWGDPFYAETASPRIAPNDGSGYTQIILSSEQYAAGSQVDVQVAAVLSGTVSDWSTTQTITIPESTWSTSPSPSLTPFETPFSSPQSTTDFQPDSGDHWNQMSIAVLVIVVVVVVDGLALSIYLAKKRHKKLSKT